jgi:hypothetical protein
LDQKRVVVLDALRRERNVADYTGDDVDESSVKACLEQAKGLLDDVLEWRRTYRAELVPKRS